MNSSTTCQLTVIKQSRPNTLRKKDISRTRPPPSFLRVLVLDDKKCRGIANAEMIRVLGHAVELAGDGITALRLAAANCPDAVLLSTDLEGFNGLQVAKHLRIDYPKKELLIIGLATRPNSLLRRKCVSAGMDLVLGSPLDAQAIDTLLLFECARLAAKIDFDSTKQSRKGLPPIPAHALNTAMTGWLKGGYRYGSASTKLT